MTNTTLLCLLIVAIIGLIVGYCGEGKKITSQEKLCTVVKWISIIILALYVLVIVAVLTDGFGDVPLLGGGAYWVHGYWRRR